MFIVHRAPFIVATPDITPLLSSAFDGVPIVGLSAPALLSVVVLLLLTGKIIPRIQLREKQEECDRWREAYEKEREARAMADSQSASMLEAVRTNHAVIVAMFETLQDIRASSGGRT